MCRATMSRLALFRYLVCACVLCSLQAGCLVRLSCVCVCLENLLPSCPLILRGFCLTD
jgi:hypothetical protein